MLIHADFAVNAKKKNLDTSGPTTDIVATHGFRRLAFPNTKRLV